MIDFLLRRFYTLWGFVLLIVPSMICLAWMIITQGTASALEAKSVFMGSFIMFSYYEFTWFVSLFLSTIPFFFGVRLIQGSKQSRIIGILMMVIAAAYMGFSVFRIMH